MPCGLCNKTPENNRFNTYSSTPPASTENCDFTLEMLELYRDKLKCVKENGLYDALGVNEAKINSFLGIVISSINYQSNYCRFQKELVKAQDLIFKMANQQLC